MMQGSIADLNNDVQDKTIRQSSFHPSIVANKILTSGWSIASLNASFPPALRALTTFDFSIEFSSIFSVTSVTNASFSAVVVVGLV